MAAARKRLFSGGLRRQKNTCADRVFVPALLPAFRSITCRYAVKVLDVGQETHLPARPSKLSSTDLTLLDVSYRPTISSNSNLAFSPPLNPSNIRTFSTRSNPALWRPSMTSNG